MDLIVDFMGALTDESLTPVIPESLPSGLPVIDATYQRSKSIAYSAHLDKGDKKKVKSFTPP